MEISYSKKLFAEAEKHLVGGVNSPVRAFKAVGGTPLFISRAKGSHIWDADGNDYIDYVGSWGPAVLGHAPTTVLKALHDAARDGLSFGACHIREIKLAQAVKEAFPSMELMRFVNSGTEATMSAIRVARGTTKRSKIIKFDGCYHGHADSLLAKAGSGLQTLRTNFKTPSAEGGKAGGAGGRAPDRAQVVYEHERETRRRQDPPCDREGFEMSSPDSAGVPEEIAALTLVARYNDLDSVKRIFSQSKKEIAAVIVEPVVGNMGCIPPVKGFLEGLREITANEGALLIFDEVITGFRVAFGGAQELTKIKPDLTCLGKIIGGGLSVGAYGGRREVMEQVAPLGPVYQAGTLSGNPLAMAAGLATLQELKLPNVYSQLEEKGAFLEKGLRDLAARLKIPLQINRVGSLFSFFFTEKPVVDDESARQADSKKFARLFSLLLQEGIYLAPSAFEAGFISLAHTEEDLDFTLKAFEKALAQTVS